MNMVSLTGKPLLSKSIKDAFAADKPLRALRESLGMSPQSVIDKGVYTSFSSSINSVDHLYMIEARGTTNYFVITSLSAIYGFDPEEIAYISSKKPEK